MPQSNIIGQESIRRKLQNSQLKTDLAVYTDCSLGRQTYTKMKQIFSSAGMNILPAWRHLHLKQNEVTQQFFLHLSSVCISLYFKPLK